MYGWRGDQHCSVCNIICGQNVAVRNFREVLRKWVVINFATLTQLLSLQTNSDVLTTK